MDTSHSDNFRWIKKGSGSGFYSLHGSRYGVASMNATNDDGDFLSRKEWALVRFRAGEEHDSQGGENLDWFDTMREARDEAERRHRREAMQVQS